MIMSNTTHARPEELLSGVYVANVTPMRADERCSIDVEAYLGHVSWLAGHGVAGVIPFGTNGEGPVITAAEKRTVFDALLGDSLPSEQDWPDGFQIVPTVAEGNLPDTLDQLDYLDDHDVPAVMVLPPFYFKPVEPAGMRSFYQRVLSATRHPVIMYHIPKYAVPIPAELVLELDVWGVKDSAGDPGYAEAVHEAGRGVLLGTEDDLPRRLATAEGSISALANIVPEQVVALYDHVRAGRHEQAETVSAQLQQIRAMTKQFSSIAVLKRIAGARQGAELGAPRPPQLPLPPDFDTAAAMDMIAPA